MGENKGKRKEETRREVCVRVDARKGGGSEKRAGQKLKSVREGRKHAEKNHFQGMGLWGRMWERG